MFEMSEMFEMSICSILNIQLECYDKVVQLARQLQAMRRVKKGETKASRAHREYVQETLGDVGEGVVTMNAKADTMLHLLQNPGASLDDDLENATDDQLQSTWPYL